MLLNVLKQNWKRFLLLLVIYFLFLLLWFGVQVIIDKRVEQKDQETKEVLQQISYTEDESEIQIDELEKYLDDNMLSDWSLGYVYQALAKLYYMSGNDMKYNEHVSNAIYYFEKSDQKNEMADLYTQYIGKLYSNGAYKSCEWIYDDLSEKVDISECDEDIQIAYYLGEADIAEMLENNLQARNDIKKATKIINAADKYEEQEVDRAKAQLLLARIYINEANFEEAERIMDSYSDKDRFGLDDDNMYLTCDYLLPYYELETKLYLHDGKYMEASNSINLYLEICDKYNFRRMKLNLLNYVYGVDNVEESTIVAGFNDIQKELTQETLNEFSEQYGEYLITDVKDHIDELEDSQYKGKEFKGRIFVFIQLIFIGTFIFIFIRRILVEVRIDGLTRLRNRKCYEEDRERLFRRKDPYYLLIIDIDNFKMINDTFGHQTGDDVLVGISSLLKKYENGYIRCYRYGGEEICIIFKHSHIDTIRALSEQMCANIYGNFVKADMKVTVSGGLAFSSDGRNVFRKADELLYQAKSNGKNHIEFEP